MSENDVEKNILGVITARGGSKGIPGKNIKLLGSKPLIAYSIEVAKQSKYLTDIIISTNDEEIAEVARQYEADVPFMRPKELAEDETPHLPVMQHAVSFMEKQNDIVYDAVVILQPTSPFRLPEDIDKTIEVMYEEDTDSAVSLVRLQGTEHPSKAKKLVGKRVKGYCLEETEGVTRQNLPDAYKRSGAVYVMKRSTLMEKNRLYGDSIAGHVVPRARYIDIDEPYDWALAEYLLKMQEG